MALTESCWPTAKPSGSSCDDPHPQTISLAVQLFAVPTSLIRRRVGTGQSGSSMLARNRKRVSRVTAPSGADGMVTPMPVIVEDSMGGLIRIARDDLR